jgi:hypothetical protein
LLFTDLAKVGVAFRLFQDDLEFFNSAEKNEVSRDRSIIDETLMGGNELQIIAIQTRIKATSLENVRTAN